jgi:predicted NBD/HSP70 family sugar kinase
MLTGTNLEYTKTFNVRIVLETIRLYGPLSRIEIARRTQLTAQTVTNITRRLIQSGMILEADRLQEGRGAPSILLKINSDGAFSIGLDLDKDHLTGVLVDLLGNPRQQINKELKFPSPDEAMRILEDTAKELISREGVSLDKIWGVGLGLPGPFSVSDGMVVKDIVNPIGLPGWSNVPVRETLSRNLSLPVFIENNANAAAIGELWYGKGRHIGTFFYVYFGAGLGGGVVINGQPYFGFTGNAGELGYYPAHNTFYGDQNSQKPHLGQFFRLPSLYKKLNAEGYSVTNLVELEELYNQQNALLLSWIEQGASHLAPLILAIEYLVDPQAIFFGGRLPDPIINELLEKLKIILPTLRIREKTSYPDLLNAAAGAEAAALGLATIPVYESMAPLPGLLMKTAKNNYRSLVPLVASPL